MRTRLLGIALICSGFATAAEPRWPVELPLTLEKNLPLAQITVNRAQSLTFIIDSAAAGCVIDGERAAEIGLKTSGNVMSSGSGGAQPGGSLRGITLDLGGLEIRPAQCMTFDMKALKFKGPVDGILGMPLFRTHVVEIDYPGLRLRIFKPEAFRPAAKAEVFPLRMTTGPVVSGTIKVRGRTPIDTTMQLDTGSAHVLTMVTPFVDRLELLDVAEEVTKGSTLGFGGAAVDMVGRIEEVRIGRFAAVKPTVRFSRQSTGSFGTEANYSANMGGEFFKKYKVTFDIPGRRLLIEE